MDAHAEFDLDVDVPFPLNITPRQVVEATGNAAVNRVLRTLLTSLCQSIVADHSTWLASLQEAEAECESNPGNAVPATA